jgi:undecaprenyl diphosphate synthase
VALFASSTRAIPPVAEIPRHIAIIMDGNGRWAKKRFLPRVAGHQRGLEAVRSTVKSCVDLGVEYLTLFAFSSENWRRPAEEVSFLMQLFLRALEQEVAKLHKNNIRLRIIGDRSRFDDRLVGLIAEAEQHTAENSALTLTIAANYGGRWDILQALRGMLAAAPERAQDFSEEDLAAHLSMSWAPEPDLFIRTGGEKRISNFLLWQLAYTELHFTDTLWPDFNAGALKKAIHSYQQRERRFGRTSEQLQNA